MPLSPASPKSLHSQTDPLIRQFAAALRDRVGKERFEMWFARSVDWAVAEGENGGSKVQIVVAGEFALERLRKNYVREIRAAAASLTPIPHIELVAAARRPEVAEALAASKAKRRARRAPASAEKDSRRTDSHRRSGATSSINDLAAASIASATDRRRRLDSRHAAAPPPQMAASFEAPATRSSNAGSSRAANEGPAGNLTTGAAARSSATMDDFIVGPSSALAHTAATMVCNSPTSSTLVYLSGPSGVGKSHLLSAITDTLRRRHRMRSVLQVTAEQFTNEFVAVVGKSSITNFRTRYRKVDALLVDDVHFIAGKKATMREFGQTINAINAAGCPIVLAGATTPHDTDGITAELSGRMTSGLVCPIMPLCDDLRRRLLLRYIETRCPLAIDGEVLEKIVPMLPADGRMISGVANAIHLMQRMNGRSPNWSEVKQHCSHLLHGAIGQVNMKSIEKAVCDLFQLESGSLRSGSQARRVTQPRMLAMYLSRQKTSSAYAEIAKHYNIRSHSTAMAAERNVEKWLAGNATVGRGPSALTAAEAIERIESYLRRGA